MSALDVERIRAAVRGCRIGSQIVVLDETTSTNDAVLQLQHGEPREGFVVFAETQTSGRGQRGNVWHSAHGKGLWFSVSLLPEIDVAASPALTAWAAETVARVLRETSGGDAKVKQPNDIYIAARKIAGVLVEMRARPQARHVAVLGVGVNANQVAIDFPDEVRSTATSLALETGVAADRTHLAIALLRALDASYAFGVNSPQL